MDTIFENESGDDEGEDGESAGKHEFKPGNTLALGGYDSLNMAVFHLNVFDWNGGGVAWGRKFAAPYYWSRA